MFSYYNKVSKELTLFFSTASRFMTALSSNMFELPLKVVLTEKLNLIYTHF